MTAHIRAEHDQGIAASTTDPGWLELSAELAEHACVHADRDDLIVTVAPGAGRGAPACYVPTKASIELDAKHWNAANLAGTDLDDTGDRARYAAAWGLLVHECAHAAHSTWTPADAPDGTPPAVVDASSLLEESRIEAAQIARRPDDRTWLRASTSTLILDEMKTDTEGWTRGQAGSAAGLVLARTGAGILNATETEPVRKAAEEVLGAETLTELARIWTAAHALGDGDVEGMLGLAREWVEAIGHDEEQVPQDLAEALAKAIGEAVEAIARAVETELPQPRTSDPNDGEEEDLEPAERTAHEVFDRPHHSGLPVRTRTRAPKPTEQRAARTLARALSTAGVQERAATKTTSVAPPGRLRMRGALAGDAQRAAGATPTAEPFVRTTRKLAPAPPLRVGIACDISGSMKSFTKPVASAAWILANAAKHTTVEATTATVVFGDHVEPITRPGVPPAKVTDFKANHGWEDIDTAITALDGALGLSRPGAARLLVVISDGLYWGAPRIKAQQLVDRLVASGCGVLWLSPEGNASPLDGVHTLTLDDPAQAARAIGKAATAALKSAQRA